MKFKQGITLMILTVAIAIMFVLVTSASVIGYNSINTAKFDDYMSQLNRISDNVNQYFLQNSELPMTTEQIDSSSFSTELYNSVVANEDTANRLFVIDMNKIPDSSVSIGSGSVSDKDVCIVADNSLNVYYLKGFKYKDKVYFTSLKK